MRKNLFLIFLFLLISIKGQEKKTTNKKIDKITVEQAKSTNEPKIIATFIKENPDHPETRELRSKLLTMVVANANKQSNEEKTNIPKTIKPKSTTTDITSVQKEKNKNFSYVLNSKTKHSENDETTRKLNHLFSNEPNKTDVLIEIENYHSCTVIYTFRNKNKKYSLNIEPQKSNFILINKGQYELNSENCSGTSSYGMKNFNSDSKIILGTKPIEISTKVVTGSKKKKK